MMRTPKPSVALLFALLCSVFAISIEARKSPEECSASCGDITDIRDPFRLPTSPAGCGESDYQLTCENNRTFLKFRGSIYFVRNISYENNLIRVVDANLANRQCRLPSRSLAEEDTLGDGRFGIPINYNYVAFLRCPANNITDRAYARADCLSVNNTNVFLNYTDDSYSPAPPSCRVIRTVLTPPNMVNGSYDYESLAALMAEGFDMGWSVKCRDCTRGGGDCRFDYPDNPSRYRSCNNEANNDREDARNVILFFGGIIGGGILVLIALGVLIYKCCIKRRRSRTGTAAKPTENQNQQQPSSP